MTSGLKPAFVFDVNRCVGCRACEMACVNANQLVLKDLPASGSWREVRTFNELRVPGVENLHLSLACNHCAAAPCLEQCPARAYSRDPATGAVLIDGEKCLGCRYCAWVCPYDAPRFNTALGIMTKCTFCVDRQDDGLQPACTLSCPTGALSLAKLDTQKLTQQVVGFARASTQPAVSIVPLQDNRQLPLTHLPDSAPPWRIMWNKVVPRISFQHEWALAVFTLLLAVLTGLLAGVDSGRLFLDWRVFLAVGSLGMGLSAIHLGRQTRAWRAALHLNRSHLSREIILSSAFILLATVGLMKFSITAGVIGQLLASLPGWWLRLTVYLGLASLLAVDLVYQVARIRGSGTLHSAQALGTGLFFLAATLGDLWVLGTVGALKLLLFWTRQLGRKRLGLWVPWNLAWVRTLFLVTGIFLCGWAHDFSWAAFLTLAAAEFLDRGWYYEELEIPTPDSMMMDEMTRRLP